MKKLSWIMLTALLFSYGSASALTVRLYGSSGVVIKDGKTRICPGFSFNCCATVEITWRDVWEYIQGKTAALPATVSETNGNVTCGNLVIDKSFFDAANESTPVIDEETDTEVFLSD